jgi:GAF domain
VKYSKQQLLLFVTTKSSKNVEQCLRVRFAGVAGLGSDDFRGAEHNRAHGLPHPDPHAVANPVPESSGWPSIHFSERLSRDFCGSHRSFYFTKPQKAAVFLACLISRRATWSARTSTQGPGELLSPVAFVRRRRTESQFFARKPLWEPIPHQRGSDWVRGHQRRGTQISLNSRKSIYISNSLQILNIADAYSHERFDNSVDEGTNFKHKSILCMPIKNSSGQIIGVIQVRKYFNVPIKSSSYTRVLLTLQLVNKFDDLAFTRNDENFVEAFAIFCGMGIHNTHMWGGIPQRARVKLLHVIDFCRYENAVVAMAKQSVTLEVLSYHASASLDEALRLKVSYFSIAGIFSTSVMCLILAELPRTFIKKVATAWFYVWWYFHVGRWYTEGKTQFFSSSMEDTRGRLRSYFT